jgi:DNA-binding NarL/FixJ family response regulator
MRNVLLVEDEPDSRDVLARALSRAGYTCTAVATSAEAREAIARVRDFEAAVVDVKLGTEDKGGVDLVRPLREGCPGVAIVVITAFADLDTVKRALNEGASFLMEKPFASAELLQVLARVLSDRSETAHLVERSLRRAKLTDKETEIARLVLKGLPSAEIAHVLGISEKTVRQHVSQVYLKCGVSSRAELFHHVFPS